MLELSSESNVVTTIRHKYLYYIYRVNPGDAVGPESWSSRYISDSLRKNALKCRPITSLEAKQLNE